MNQYESLAKYYDEILRLMHEELGRLTDKEKMKLRPIKKRYKEGYEKIYGESAHKKAKEGKES